MKNLGLLLGPRDRASVRWPACRSTSAPTSPRSRVSPLSSACCRSAVLHSRNESRETCSSPPRSALTRSGSSPPSCCPLVAPAAAVQAVLLFAGATATLLALFVLERLNLLRAGRDPAAALVPFLAAAVMPRSRPSAPGRGGRGVRGLRRCSSRRSPCSRSPPGAIPARPRRSP